MTHRYIKISVTSVVLVLAFSGLLWSTLRDGTEYFKHVDEVMTTAAGVGRQAAAAPRLRRPRLDPRQADTLEYRFKVQNKGSVVDASYRGVVPDTFKDEAEVVLKGRLTPTDFTSNPTA